MPQPTQHISARSRVGRRRAGITIVEVLTAMVVALIGVFGVMILIPFAVKQAETGLDLDDARRQAENAIAQFQIGGYQRLVTNLPNDVARPLWIDNTGLQVSAPDVYAIDPLSIFANGEVFDQFPPSYSISPPPPQPNFPNFPLIKEVNLADYDPDTGISVWTGDQGEAMARRLFRNTDDLVFGSALSDLDPPQQIFDTGATGEPVGRQSRGEMSWMAIVVPSYDDGNPNQSDQIWKYRLYVLVFKNRVLQTSSTNPVARFPIGKVMSANDIGYGGGNVTLESEISDVRKDDWVMLINEDSELPQGFQKQVAFFRVIATFGNTMTLDGPDFHFVSGSSQPLTTYAVHLANYDAAAMANGELNRLGHVVSVYERTFVWELDSDWNR